MRLWLSFLCLCVSMLGYAMKMSSYPPALLYQGQPMDPLCLFEFNTKNATVSLATCGIHSSMERSIVDSKRSLLVSKGYVGYEYQVKVNDAVSLHGYSYYKVVSAHGNRAIVQTINHTGGTGEVTSLSLIERNGASLNIRILSTGDRCNHGILEASSNNNQQITYRVKWTAYDFLEAAHDNPHHLKAYDDLDDCAICCKATAVYQHTEGDHRLRDKLLYVDLATFSQEPINSKTPQTVQKCFDQLFQQSLAKGKTVLNEQQLTQFTHRFNQVCVKKTQHVCAR